MPRQQRQRDELRELCIAGALRRAIDLAYLHFAEFGRDRELLDLLEAAVHASAAPASLRVRLADLRSASDQPPVSDEAHGLDGTSPRETIRCPNT